MRITVRDTARWRRDPEQLRELARRSVQRELLVTSDPEGVRCAFQMIFTLGGIDMTEAASHRVGALIGDLAEVVPGRALNGWPMFLSVGFLHRDDVPAFDAEVSRMLEALGAPRP